MNTPTFPKIKKSNNLSPETPKIYDFDFEMLLEEEELLDNIETQNSKFESFKMEFDIDLNENPKSSFELSNNSEVTFSFSILSGSRSEGMAMFSNSVQLPSIGDLPLAEDLERCKKSRGISFKSALKLEKYLYNKRR